MQYITGNHVSLYRAISSAVLSMFSFLMVTPAFADDPANLAFDQGSVLVICGERVTGGDISSDQFFAGFPDWITMLQAKANEGVVARAHYLSRVKEGVFIVFSGPDKETAMKNASDVVGELTSVYARVTGNEGVEICRSYEIGPVAALPR